MTGYEVETVVLLVALVPVAVLGCVGRVEERLVALQLVSAVSVLVLLLVAVATGQSSILIVPLTLPALGAAGTLVYTRMLAPQQDAQSAQHDQQQDEGATGERSEAA